MKAFWTKTTRQSEKKQETRRSGLPTRPQLGMESLEARELYAGNVLASVSSVGTLLITGDNSSNCVAVDQYTDGGVKKLWVHACPGDTTKINGVLGAQLIVPKGAVKGISASLAGGDDTFGFGPQGGASVDGFLSMSMGSGKDQVDIGAYSEINGKLSINTSSGDDKVHLEVATVTSNTVINTGSGKDKVEVKSATYLKGHLYIDTGTGTDQLHLQNSAVGGTSLIKTGDDSDLVCIDHMAFDKAVEVYLGDATGFLAFDVLDVHDSTFKGSFKADGEAGGDIYDADNNTFNVAPVVMNFESYVDIDCDKLFS